MPIRVVAGAVPWYFGTAGYPPGTLVPSVPDTADRVFLVRDESAPGPGLPAGFNRVASTCRERVCVDTLNR